MLEPGGGDTGCPREDPPRLLVPLEFSTEGLDGERKSRFPPKRNKILDSSDHLLSPNSSSNIHPSPSLSLAAEAAHASPGRERAPAGGGARAVRGCGVHGRRQGRLPARLGGHSHDAATARLPARPPDAKTPASHWESFQESLVGAPIGKKLNPEGKV